MHLCVYAGEHDGYLFFLRHFTKAFQVMDTCGVDERNLAHTDDAYFGAVAELCHHFLELRCNAEEVRAVDFVHLYAFRDDKMLFIRCDVRFGVRVYFILDNRNFSRLHHTAHEEHAGDDQTHFDGNCQVEDNCQEEGYQ